MNYTEKRLEEFDETISNVMGICTIDSLRIKDFLIESITQALAEERERIERKIKQSWNYPCNCDRKNILCIHDFSQMKVALSSLKANPKNK